MGDPIPMLEPIPMVEPTPMVDPIPMVNTKLHSHSIHPISHSLRRRSIESFPLFFPDDALEYRPTSNRVYLRRLSGSEASTFGTLDYYDLGSGGSGGTGSSSSPSSSMSGARLILRPLSVQERIRELNMRARHFAETVLAVQLQQQQTDDFGAGGGGAAGKRGIAHTRSLQVLYV